MYVHIRMKKNLRLYLFVLNFCLRITAHHSSNSLTIFQSFTVLNKNR